MGGEGGMKTELEDKDEREGEESYGECTLVTPVIPGESAGLPACSLELCNPLVELLLVLSTEVVRGSAVVMHLEGECGVLLGLGQVVEVHAWEHIRNCSCIHTRVNFTYPFFRQGA